MTRSSRSDAVLRRIERRVADFVLAHELLTAGQRVLLLLSGGADSMALMALVRRCDDMLGLGLALGALHVDYAARGAASRRDRRIVEHACAAADVPLDLLALDTKLVGADFQERARRLRLDEARRLLACGRYDVAATGHNLDDQAETVLYRLVKYGAPSALVGMPPGAGSLVRPLLCLRAAEVRAYCRGRGIEYGDDHTNAQQTYARNVVRLAALPQLERLNPRAAEALAAAAETAREQQELLAQLTDAAWARVTTATEGPGESARHISPVLDLQLLAREPRALRTLLLRRLARHALGDDALVERRLTQALVALATGRSGTLRVRLRGGWEAVREYDRLWLRTAQVAQGPTDLAAAADVCEPLLVDLSVLQEEEVFVSFCGRRFALRFRTDGRPDTAVGRVALAGERPVQTLVLRHPLPGDRFVPMGLGAETSVARFLREQKVPLAARAHVLVIEADGLVAWVELPGRPGRVGAGTGASRGRAAPLQKDSGTVPPGGRVAESFRVTESSTFTIFLREQ